MQNDKTILDKLKEYFENTPQEQIEADWAKSAYLDEEGITVEDFLAANKTQNNMIEEMREFTNKYEGTDKYNDVMLAIEFGMKLNEKYYGKE